MFHIGQKVVCIAGASACSLAGETDAVVGNIYTVRGILRWRDLIALRLEEIVNPPMPTFLGRIERGMWSGRFRPIVERKTDISIFKKMLTPSDEKIGADA